MDPSPGIDRPMDRALRSWRPFLILLGLYLTLRGYHSFDGDQAYRLPLLLHRQDPGLYADDPFVRSFDQFNPHRGSLALLDAATTPLGLPAGLFLVFVLTFLTTCRAVLRTAASIWSDRGQAAGWVAVILFLAAKAGNIGTNHLFEAMVLDRLVALGLGWQAIADVVTRPGSTWWRSPIWIALAAVIHPSVGLQLAMLIAASWLVWACVGRLTQVNWSQAIRAAAIVGLALMPGLIINLPRGTSLQGGLSDRVFWILSVELQSPQHMLPHLWRMPQWLSWFSYLAMAGLAVAPSGLDRSRALLARAAIGWAKIAGRSRLRQEDDRGRSLVGGGSVPRPDSQEAAARQPIVRRFAPSPLILERGSIPARRRLLIMLAITVGGLGAAWYAIEERQNIHAAVLQPFRMSTVARGLALILISGRLLTLWRTGRPLGRARATVLAAGFLGDWLLVVTAVAELSVALMEWICGVPDRIRLSRVAPAMTWAVMLALGTNFLAHHDTEYGHRVLLPALAMGLLAGAVLRRSDVVSRLLAGNEGRRVRRIVTAAALAWAVPILALLASMIPPEHPAARSSVVRGLVDRCRFLPMPLDDIERLALWCRDHTPAAARFIGPPGPKTFRLWSGRSLAFNRSGSPYHGAGLADWFARFQDHVDYHGSPEAFVEAYREHRHEFEARYDAMTDEQLAALAARQGAGYIIAGAPKPGEGRTAGPSSAPLELLRAEGGYAAYRLDPSALVHRQP